MWWKSMESCARTKLLTRLNNVMFLMIIRLAYKENVDIQFIKQNLLECVADAIQIYKKIKKEIIKINK